MVNTHTDSCRVKHSDKESNIMTVSLLCSDTRSKLPLVRWLPLPAVSSKLRPPNTHTHTHSPLPRWKRPLQMSAHFTFEHTVLTLQGSPAMKTTPQNAHTLTDFHTHAAGTYSPHRSATLSQTHALSHIQNTHSPTLPLTHCSTYHGGSGKTPPPG